MGFTDKIMFWKKEPKLDLDTNIDLGPDPNFTGSKPSQDPFGSPSDPSFGMNNNSNFGMNRSINDEFNNPNFGGAPQYQNDRSFGDINVPDPTLNSDSYKIDMKPAFGSQTPNYNNTNNNFSANQPNYNNTFRPQPRLNPDPLFDQPRIISEGNNINQSNNSTQNLRQDTNDKNLEIISIKLDNLKVALENINQRLANIERMAQDSKNTPNSRRPVW